MSNIELEMIAAAKEALAVIPYGEETLATRLIIRAAMEGMCNKYGMPIYEEKVWPRLQGKPTPVFTVPRLVKA